MSGSPSEMSNPRLNHLPIGKKKARPPAASLILDDPDNNFAHAVEAYNKWIRENLGDDWTFAVTQVNPLRIIECAPEAPYHAAMMCQSACHILAAGHHARVHDYMIAAYVIALSLKNNDLHIGFVASKIKDGRSTSEGIPRERFKSDILHYLFIYIFAQSKLVKRNRAWQWADSLQAYFDDDRDPAEVEKLLKSYGQDKLRIVWLAAKNERTAHRREVTGNASLSDHIGAILAESEEDDPADAPNPAAAEDEITDFGARGLPPEQDHNEDGGGGSETPNGEGENDEEEQGAAETGTGDEADAAGSIDGEVIIERLHTVLVGMMNVSAQLAEPNLGSEQQKRLLPLMLLLSNEIVDLQRMLSGR